MPVTARSAGISQGKRAAKIGAPAGCPQPGLFRRRPDAAAQVCPQWPTADSAQRPGNLLRLVEAPDGLPSPVQRHRHHRVGRIRQRWQAKRKELAQAARHGDLPAKLGSSDQPVYRVFICKGGQRGCEGLQSRRALALLP